MPAPDKIISDSRDLEGCSVDLGSDSDLTHSERIELLAELANELDRLTPGTMEHARLIDRYNSNLYVAEIELEFHQQELPRNARIPDDWTLKSYLGLEQRLRLKGPTTIEDSWKTHEIVAHIAVRRSTWGGLWGRPAITVLPLQVFKGGLAVGKKVRFRQLVGWGMEYERGEYIVFWELPHEDNYVWGLKCEVVDRAGGRTVLGPKGQSYWPFASKMTGRFRCEAAWDDVIQWLTNRAESDGAERP